MNTGEDLKTIGHHYEDLRNKAYADPGTGGEPYTVGIGCTGVDSEGNPITKDTYWSDEKALYEYAYRIDREFAPGVRAAVKATLTQKQFDMLVDFAFNVGMGNFRGSTLLRKLNADDYPGAANEFPKWNKGGGRVLKGLQRRRWAEKLVFEGGDANAAIQEAEAKYP